MIKTVREVTGLGLKDSKDLVEAAMPRRVVLDLTFDEAHDIAAKFDATGARVVVMPHVHVGEVPGGYLKTPLAWRSGIESSSYGSRASTPVAGSMPSRRCAR